MNWPIVLITGTDDNATATALRLFRSGFKVILFSHQKPLDLHFHRNFSRIVFAGQGEVEGITAITFSKALELGLLEPDQSALDFINFMVNDRKIPIVFPEDLKKSPIIPVHYVVNLAADLYSELESFLPETAHLIDLENRSEGHLRVSKQPATWGQVQYPFLEPKEIPENYPKLHVQKRIHAPLEGVFVATKNINDPILEKEEIGKLNEIPILSPYSGKISGLINSGAMVSAHTPIAEITTGRLEINARILPMEAFALAGGVLEAILYDWKNKLA